MELFQKLGDEIEDFWLEKNYNEEELPAIAAEALKRANLPSKLTAWDVVEWSLKQRELPPQRDLHGNFADPPITIFSGPRFHIDVYFWFEGTTAIHQHGFCGAFQVLLGSSIHSWYEFETHEVINTFAEIGEMSLKVCELLEVGAVQEIMAGKQYIHSLFHLEMPSATIVVRTDRSPLHLPQFAYEKPNLAIDPFFEQPTTTKKLQILSAAFRAKHAEADRMATELLESSDLQTSFVILSRLRHLVGANQLEQLFKIQGAVSRFQQFLDVVSRRHEKNGEIFKPIFDRLAAIDEIVNRRSFVTNPEHRFFMALLMNVDERERIFSLIKQRFPDADPVEKVLDWVFDLAETRVVGVETSNALGIPNFGDAEMFVLEGILNGKADDEISVAYGAENPGSDASDAIAKVRNAVILRPLLN
ncbi:MAG: hypothetical protein ABL999_04020 [Pyrinomonadaceae bacterium]